MTVFRSATFQAIVEIISENAQAGRFGLALTEQDLETACTKIVDLFEMTLELRNRTQNVQNIQNKGASASLKESKQSAQQLNDIQTPSIQNTLPRRRSIPLAESELHLLRSNRS